MDSKGEPLGDCDDDEKVPAAAFIEEDPLVAAAAAQDGALRIGEHNPEWACQPKLDLIVNY